MIKTCVICETEFEPFRHKEKAKTCSVDCYKQHRAADMRNWRANNGEKDRAIKRRWDAKHPDAQKQKYDKMRAALQLIKELETKGIGALL